MWSARHHVIVFATILPIILIIIVIVMGIVTVIVTLLNSNFVITIKMKSNFFLLTNEQLLQHSRYFKLLIPIPIFAHSFQLLLQLKHYFEPNWRIDQLFL